jgi:hypothetical protein
VKHACAILLCLSLYPAATVAAEPETAGAPAKAAGDATSAGDRLAPYADNACIQCHRDLAGRSSEIVNLEWAHSVHYDAKVTCDGCHGGDPSVKRESFESDDQFKAASHLRRDPEFLSLHKPDRDFVTAARGRSVSYFCGKCHSDIKEKHLGSPHGGFGDPSCLYCHGQGSHQITDATPDIIDTRSREENGRCTRCHTASTMQAVARIKHILIDTQQQIESSGQAYRVLESLGYRNLELERLHHHAAEVQSQLRRIFHSFDMREINNFASEIQDTVDRTTATLELVQRVHEAQRRQTIVGIGAVTLLLSLAGLMVFYKRSFLEPNYHHHGGG